MPCDTRLLPGQTITQRKEEIRNVVQKLVQGLTAGRIKVRVGPQGAVAFDGFSEADRARVTDACMYRKVMSSGSALARQQIEKAEAMAGRTVDRKQVAIGAHSHDNGLTWHSHKG